MGAVHALTGPTSSCRGQWFDGFDEDAIRVQASGLSVTHNTIIDRCLDMTAHRDAIQLIPTGRLPRGQYAGELLSSLEISHNHIRSNGSLQGVFCSDGLLNDINIFDNVIQTAGQHHITLSGLLSGMIYANVGAEGESPIIRLYPLRIGGNPDGHLNVWVISFANTDKYRYAPADDIIECWSDEHGRHVDLREAAVNPRDVYLRNFDLDGFRDFVAEQPQQRDVTAHCQQLQRWAVGFGDRVQEV